MKWFQIFWINLAIIFSGLVCAELIFGSWISGSELSPLNIPRNERRVLDVSQLMPSTPNVVYTRDQYGLRGDYGGDLSRIDVLVLGGSTTNELYVTDEATWVAQLGKKFREGGKSLTFANAAIDGQSTLGHIVALKRWLLNLPRLRPQYVLFYIGINDTAVDEERLSPSDQIQSPSSARRFKQYFINHSALYNLFRVARGACRARNAKLLHAGMLRNETKWFPVTMPVDNAELLEEYKHKLPAFVGRLEALTMEVRKWGAKPIFITQRRGDSKQINGVEHVLMHPNWVKNSREISDRAEKILKILNETTVATCERLSLVCVDLASKIAFEDNDFYDLIHTTPSGSMRIAEFLYGELDKELLKSR